MLRLIQVRMAPLAILEREGDREVADAAEHPVIDVVHAKMLGALFLDVEDVRMTIGAVKPFRVLLMGEDRPGLDHFPFRFKKQDLFERDRLVVWIE